MIPAMTLWQSESGQGTCKQVSFLPFTLLGDKWVLKKTCQQHPTLILPGENVSWQFVWNDERHRGCAGKWEGWAEMLSATHWQRPGCPQEKITLCCWVDFKGLKQTLWQGEAPGRALLLLSIITEKKREKKEEKNPLGQHQCACVHVDGGLYVPPGWDAQPFTVSLSSRSILSKATPRHCVAVGCSCLDL